MIKDALTPPTENQKIKRRQTLAMGVVGVSVLAIVVGLTQYLTRTKGTPVPTPPVLETVSESQDHNHMLMERIDQDNTKLKSGLDEVLDSIKNLQKESEGFDQKAADLMEAKQIELQKRIEEGYLEKLKQLEEGASIEQVRGDADSLGSDTEDFDESIESEPIQRLTLNLLKDHPHKKDTKKTVDNTIPAGTFAESVLMSGLDASTSLTASSDPRPVLLRITDDGNLPRRFKSDLKDCHCIGSAYGDLSSERVYMRLEKMSCTERLTEEIVETEVAGYVTGSDGRAGIRGIVISKEGPYLTRSLMGGILSGISDVANPENQQSLSITSQGLSQTNPLGPVKLFASGVGRGTSKAMDRLADYYIDRAEQLQPVIQIPAGQVVDIIFTQGSAIGESTAKREIGKVRDRARDEAAQKAAKDDFGFETTDQMEGDNDD